MSERTLDAMREARLLLLERDPTRVGRAARALGLVKGEEMERLTHAAEQLAQAETEIADRQSLLEKLTKSLAERDQKIQGQQAYIETLSADVTQMRHLAALAAAPLKDLVGV